MDLGAALLAIFIGLVVKVAVMTGAGYLVARLYRPLRPSPRGRLWLLLPPEVLPEVRTLYAALILFAISELTCGIEVYVLLQSSAVIGWIHGLTSAAGMGLFALGLWSFFDKRLARFAQPGCLLRPVCRGCALAEPQGCRYRVLLQMAGVFVGLAATVPLFAPTTRLVADTRKYLLPFPSLNHWFDAVAVPWLRDAYPAYDPSGVAYYVPSLTLVLELRVLPLVALAVALVGVLLAQRRQVARAVRWLVFAAGVLAYPYLEMVLYYGTGDVLLASLGHEVAELWFLAMTAEFLTRTFGASRDPLPAGDSPELRLARPAAPP